MVKDKDNIRIISYKRFNPNFHHLRLALHDDDIRFIYMYGGSSSSKSFSASQAFLLECLSKGYNTIVFRKTGATISDSIYKTFIEAGRSLLIDQYFKPVENLIRCFNGSYIRFKGLDDPEKIKGLESYQYVLCEELSEFDEIDLKQIRKRLRGRKGQKIVSTFNPISEDHWIKRNIFDKEELTEIDNHLYGKLRDRITGDVLSEDYSRVSRKWVNSGRVVYNPRKKVYENHNPDTVIIKSTYLDNFWVVGSPDGTYGFYDAQTVADFEHDKSNDNAYYMIYALGEWGTIKTGGEFFHAFDPSIHKGDCGYVNAPVHISIDNNVLPYISISFWQVDTGDVTVIRQIHEETPSDPYNTVTMAAQIAVKYLESIGHDDMVYVYGDVSTKSGNTIDDDKRSFFDKFMDVIGSRFRCEDRMPKSNPSVSMTGEFINAIYSGDVSGVSIMIDTSCEMSIKDYIMVKKDVNGGILKRRVRDRVTGQSYEMYGHLSDTKRYLVTGVLKDRYTSFSMRRSRNNIKDIDMRYYDPVKLDLSGLQGLAEIHPDDRGKYVYAVCVVKDGYVYVTGASINDNRISEIDISRVIPADYDVHVECDKFNASYVIGLRDYIDNVRGRSIPSNVSSRIEAHSGLIRDRFVFRADYADDDGYSRFVDSVLDYREKSDMEAISVLSAIAERIIGKLS